MDRVRELTEVYRLIPHPEGGSFAECWVSSLAAGGRPLAGSIYFLLRENEISHLHVIDCDEVWYYHEGEGMRITQISTDGKVSQSLLGPNASAGQRMMVSIPAGTMFAARNLEGHGYTFVSCATAPQFTYAGFRMVKWEELKALCGGTAEALRPLIME